MTTPPEIGPALTVTQASLVLRIPARTLRDHLKAGRIRGSQLGAYYTPWLIPTTEVERVAQLLYVTPNWDALAIPADPANSAK